MSIVQTVETPGMGVSYFLATLRCASPNTLARPIKEQDNGNENARNNTQEPRRMRASIRTYVYGHVCVWHDTS